MAFMGVRISWLMFARKLDLASFAASAASRARASSSLALHSASSARLRSVMSRSDAATMVPCSGSIRNLRAIRPARIRVPMG